MTAEPDLLREAIALIVHNAMCTAEGASKQRRFTRADWIAEKDHATNAILKALATRLSAAHQPADEPHAAVGKFLSELYAIMVDPCADGTLTVDQVKNELTAAALLQREALATLQADFNDCNEVRAHWKALALRLQVTAGLEGKT